MRAKKSVDILHVYRILHKRSPPASDIEAHDDPSWLLRNERYDTISCATLFDEATAAVAELRQQSDGEEDMYDIVGDAIAANPEGFLDEHDIAPYDDVMLNAYSDSAASSDED
jgi:hypothetical protein